MRIFSFCLITALIFQLTLAQNPPTTKVDSMLVNIDKTSFSTSILYDRTFPWANLTHFNDNENLADAKLFEQALLDVRKAASDSIFYTLQQLRAIYVPDSLENKVNIGILNVGFNSINFNEDDESKGALSLQNEVFTELNNSKPNFLEHHALLVSPLKQYVKGGQIEYILTEEFLLENSLNKEIASLTANFETNTDYLLIDNGEIIQNSVMINYTTNGYKTLTFTATFNDGTSKTTQATLHAIAIVPNLPYGTQDGSINATIPFKGYDETTAKLGRLDYRIYFGNNQNKILKPVIIIDGFDPGDRRKISDADSNMPPNDHDSIEEFMIYFDSNGTPVPLIPELKIKGYDVIIVNHPTYVRNGITIDGGADFIERNGLTHVALYQWLNAQLAQNSSNEELVIIGPSMGGQISRYALAYMEKEGLPHNTRLWISLDSPHLGANIPIGLQTLVKQLADAENGAAQDFFSNQLQSAAAKQQLIEQFFRWQGNQLSQDYLNAKTIEQGFIAERGHYFFRKYYSDLFNNGLPNSLGYPQNLRKISLVNGSLLASKKYNSPWTGQEEYYLSNSEMGFNARVFQQVPFGEVHIGSLEAFAMPRTGTNNKISRFKKAWTDKSKYVSNNNSRGNLDQVPGGWFPGFQELADPIEGVDPLEPTETFWNMDGFIDTSLWIISTIFGGADIELRENERVHSFIPVFSALGILNPDKDWTEEMDRDLTCTNEIPFDAYFGPRINERHTSFTEASVRWLFEELDENEQPSTVYLSGNDIEGPDSICSTDIVTYNVPPCSGRPDSWEVSSNLNIITLSLDGTGITVSPVNANINNSGFVRAIYSYQTVEKDIWLGRADAPTFLTGPEEVHTGSIQTYRGGGSDGAESYKWILPYPFDENVDVRNPIDYNGDNWQTWPNTTGRNSHIFTGNGGHDGLVQLVAVNSCGEGGSIHMYVEHQNGGNCTTCQSPVYPYPNAANQQFSLDFTEHPDKTYLIKIYDQSSVLVYDGQSNNIEKTIDTANLDNGTYFLHIHEDDDVTIKHLIIQH